MGGGGWGVGLRLGVVVGWAELLGDGQSDNQWEEGLGGSRGGSVMGGAQGEWAGMSLSCSCGRMRPPRNS